MQPQDADDDELSHDDAWLRELAHVPHRQPRAVATTQEAEQHAYARAEDEFDPTRDLGSTLDGRYRLDAVLGAGGMGVVYAATQLRTGKAVAIKRLLLQPGVNRASAAERFVREAKAAARIGHPNVVDVYDVGGDPLAPFLVMELLAGETLRARIERKPLSWQEAQTLFAPVMHGLSCAHAAGVVHRDLKPDNLFLVAEADGRQLLKILDFGISRLSPNPNDEPETTITRTGATVGTPSYMPIEQLLGAADLDERCDVYALGVVLYEALCGQRPYAARSAVEYAAALPSRPPMPLSEPCPDLAGEREAVVMRAIALERRDRYASMEEFRAALLDPAPVRSHVAARTGRKWMVAGAALSAVIAVGGYMGRRSERMHSESAPMRYTPVHESAPAAPSMPPPPPQERHEAVVQAEPPLAQTPGAAPEKPAHKSRPVQRTRVELRTGEDTSAPEVSKPAEVPGTKPRVMSLEEF